jgi:hypothetical protein
MNRAVTILISRLFFSAFFCLWTVLQIHAQDTASWLDKIITMDGLPIEWEQSDLKTDNKGGYHYCISNDTSKLYIGLLLKDEFSKAKFLNAGFSIFLNSEGKEKRSLSIDFPLPDVEYDLSGDPRRLMDLKGIQLMGLLHAKQYDVSGFKDGNGKQNISDENKAGIQIALGLTDSGFLFYEVMIPFSAMSKKMNSFSEINQKNMAVCFLSNAITKPTGQQSQFSTSGVPPTPVSGRGGRGGQPQSESNNFPRSGNNNTPRSFGEMEKLFQNYRTWKIVNLAKSI